MTSVNSHAAATLHAAALDETAAALVVASGAASRIAARDALDVSAAALAVASVVVAVDAEGLTPVPFAWIHDAVADATRERFDLDRAYSAGLLTIPQHAVKRDAVRVRVRSAVAYANDGDAAAVVVAFPDVAMHDATLTDCGVAFVRVAHPTADGAPTVRGRGRGRGLRGQPSGRCPVAGRTRRAVRIRPRCTSGRFSSNHRGRLSHDNHT